MAFVDPLTDFAPFPTDVLPDPVSRFVKAEAIAKGIDESMIAVPLLAALASAIGTTRRILLKRGWTEPSIVWAAIVAESGCTKSPALDAVVRPLLDRQRDAMREHREEMAAHRAAMLIHECDLTAWKNKRGTDPPEPPETPTLRRCWIDDVTVERVATILAENPRGVLLKRDELRSWFAFDRYSPGKGGDAPRWLEMFGGREMVVDRQKRGTIYVPAAAVSIAGTIQPETLRKALTEEHLANGLAARLLFAYPPRRAKRWTESEVDPDLERAMDELFGNLLALCPETDERGEERPVIVTMTPAGKREWIAFYNEHASKQAAMTGDLAAAWSKLEGYAARFALIVHLIRQEALDPSCGREVDEESIRAGVVLSRWFGAEAERVYGMLHESEGDRDRRRLVEWIMAKGGSVTVRELRQGMRRFRDDHEGAHRALEELVEMKVGYWDYTTPAGGGPTSARFVMGRRTPGASAGNGAFVDGTRTVRADSGLI